MALPDPVSPAAGQDIDKAFWDAQVYERAVDLAAPWVAYTPTWYVNGAARSTIGNGTLLGKYKQIGKTCFFNIRFVWGSTTSIVTGLWYFSLPAGVGRNGYVLGYGAAQGIPVVANQSAGFVFLKRHDGQDVSSTVPGAWGAGMDLNINGLFETT